MENGLRISEHSVDSLESQIPRPWRQVHTIRYSLFAFDLHKLFPFCELLVIYEVLVLYCVQVMIFLRLFIFFVLIKLISSTNLLDISLNIMFLFFTVKNFLKIPEQFVT